MSNCKRPGIALTPNSKSLADGTNALQPCTPPGITALNGLQETLTSHGLGNPGKYLGIRQVRFKDKTKGWTTGQFHIIEATEGTWLSAATRKFGWDKRYGPEDGYGAYIEGIVRGEDGRFISPWYFHPAADTIMPGERFAIEIYKGKTERKPNGKTEPGKISPEQEDQLRPDDPIIGIATATGLAVEIAGNIFAPLAILGIPFNLIAVSSNPDVAMVEARANCYARTAFIYQEHESGPGPISRVYDRLKWKEDLYKQTQRAWRNTWKQTTIDAKAKFQKEYTRIYMEVNRNGGNVHAVSQIRLRQALKNITKHKYGTSASYCDHLLKDIAKSNWWRDSFPATVMPIWNNDRQTKYPN